MPIPNLAGRIARQDDHIQARAEIARRVETLRTSETAPGTDVLDEQAVEDDLARRRARLSQ